MLFGFGFGLCISIFWNNSMECFCWHWRLQIMPVLPLQQKLGCSVCQFIGVLSTSMALIMHCSVEFVQNRKILWLILQSYSILAFLILVRSWLFAVINLVTKMTNIWMNVIGITKNSRKLQFIVVEYKSQVQVHVNV